MEVLGVITARGGSKGILHKNIKPLASKPLIAYTIEAGLHSEHINELIVSTDDVAIATVARKWGASVPFMRPTSLATDTAAQIDVVIHALHQMEQTRRHQYDVVILLQPTTPLRTAEDIDGALSLLATTQADAVISLSPVVQGHLYYLYTLEDGRPVPVLKPQASASRRQDFPAMFVRNGAIYATRRDVLLGQYSFYGQDYRAYLMPQERSINIDSPFDWDLAECLLGRSRG